MENLKSKSLIKSCLVIVALVGLLTKFCTASSPDNMQPGEWIPDQPLSNSQLAFREDIRRELAELSDAEDRILSKIRELAVERDTIRARKRGHTQCFLNLVSCFRKRK